MKELTKRILSVLTTIAMVYTVFATPMGEILGFIGEGTSAGAAVYFTSYAETIKDGDARITEALNLVKMQAGTSAISGKTLYDLTYDFLYDCTYAVYGGAGLPYEYSNAYYNDGNGYRDSFTAKVGGTTYTRTIGASGCRAYAWFVRKVFYTKSSGTKVICESGKANAATIKEYALRYMQAGESISYGAAHANIFVAANDKGIYVLNYTGNTGDTIKFQFISYEKMANYVTARKVNIETAVFNTGENSLNLTSTPNNLGDQFVAPIKVTSSGKVLTAGSDGNVTVQNWTGADNQRWLFTKNTSDNYYEIRNGQYVLKVLDVNNGGNTNDTNIQIKEDNDSASQRFGVFGSQGSYVIKPKYSTTHVVDSDGGNNNVHLWQYYSPTIDAQKFTIEADPNPTFSNVKASSITKDNAIISAIAHKKSSTTTLKFKIVVWPKDNVSSAQTFTFNTGMPNVGKTSNEITFDLKNEKTISAGSRMTLKPDTDYVYQMTSYYNEGGITVSYTSDYYTFKTTNTCSTHSYGSWTTKTAATCTADGLKSRTCSACGKIESATIAKTGHSYTSSVTKAATCIATGVKTYKCSKCSNSYTETIAKAAHTYSSSYTVDKAANCTTAGSKSRHCTTSGCTAKTDVTTISATGHSYTSSVTKAATCIATGVKTYKCSKCSNSYTETIAKTAHNYSTSWTVDKAATCTTQGSKSHHCTASGCTAKANVTAIVAKGHSYGNWTTTKAATCTESGSKTRKCTACSHSETQTIVAQGHAFSTEWTIDKAATCTLTGSKSYHCTRCSATKQNTTIAAKGHSFGAWVITKEATHTAEGISERVCAKCNTTETQKIAKLSLDGHTHQFGEWKTVEEATCLNDGKESRTCTLCSQTESKVLSALGHEYGEWTETPATCTEKGKQSRGCSVCETEEIKVIEALGHNFGQGRIIKEPTQNETGLKENECNTCGEHIEEVIPSIVPNTTTTTTDETPTPEETTTGTDETSSDAPTSEPEDSRTEDETSSDTSNVEETDKQHTSTEWLAWTLLGVVAVGFVVTLIIVLPKRKKD